MEQQYIKINKYFPLSFQSEIFGLFITMSTYRLRSKKRKRRIGLQSDQGPVEETESDEIETPITSISDVSFESDDQQDSDDINDRIRNVYVRESPTLWHLRRVNFILGFVGMVLSELIYLNGGLNRFHLCIYLFSWLVYMPFKYLVALLLGEYVPRLQRRLYSMRYEPELSRSTELRLYGLLFLCFTCSYYQCCRCFPDAGVFWGICMRLLEGIAHGCLHNFLIEGIFLL